MMGDYFEFRDDFERSQGAPKAPKELCCVKWGAAKLCMDYVRGVALCGDTRARQLAEMLDQVGLTPDFQPNEVEPQQKAA